MVVNIKDFETAVDIANFLGGGCKEFSEYSTGMTAKDFWDNCNNSSWIIWTAAKLSNTAEEKQIIITTVLNLLKNDDYIKSDIFLVEQIDIANDILSNINKTNIDQSYLNINRLLINNNKTHEKDGYVLDAYLSVRYFILGIKFELENKEWHLNLTSCITSLCSSKSKRTEELLDTIMQNMAVELKTAFNFVDRVDI
jgi:hypothetical protein